MKTSILTTILSILSFGNVFGQKDCEILTHYQDFIEVTKIESTNNSFLYKQVVQNKHKSCFSGLMNKDLFFFNYLLENFSSNDANMQLLQLKDSLALRISYLDQLKNDSLYNSVMQTWVSKTIEKRKPKDQVTIAELLNIAIKFFTITKIDKNGNIAGKVCGGINCIKQTELVRQPFLEAFAFSSILKNYEGKTYSMLNEFKKGLMQINSINLGIDKNEKLLRSQGVMFSYMVNNEKLKSMLKNEYKNRQNELPFILIN
jgi:hypothetical protein